jgi:hypothetical protein
MDVATVIKIAGILGIPASRLLPPNAGRLDSKAADLEVKSRIYDALTPEQVEYITQRHAGEAR